MTDAVLESIVLECKKGDTHAQELLFRNFAPKMLTTCRRYATPRMQAEDLLHESFIKIFEKIHLYDPDRGRLLNWMNRIAINIALKEMRDQKELFSLSTEMATESDDDISTELIPLETILKLISELPKGYKLVFNLYVLDDFSHKEIANMLGISIHTSKSQFFKARGLLKKRIMEYLSSTSK